MQPDKWDIEKLIAMCVQEEERLKSLQGNSANLVKDKKKNFNKNAKPQGKAPQTEHHQKNTMLKLKRISANGARSMNTTREIIQTS